MQQHKGEGHRGRLRNKFLTFGINALNDYEIVELLLTLGTPRRDCKEQAKEAIKKFKGLSGVLEAGLDELCEIKGVGRVNSLGIKLFQEVSERYLKEKVKCEEVNLKSSKDVFDYLYQSMLKEKAEVFKVLFINSKNKLIEAEDVFKGSINSSAVYPREIMKKAIKYNASALIFAHNHPSGDPTPSDSDKEITKDLVDCGIIMQIKVLDHIVVGDRRYFSFADNRLI